MSKQKIYFLIPFLIVTAILFCCWALIWSGEYLASWRHYTGLALYLLLLVLSYNNIKRATIALGIYLLLAVCNLLVITPAITTTVIGIGPVNTPPFQLMSLGIFTLYLILNLNTLLDMWLDYKKGRQGRLKEQSA